MSNVAVLPRTQAAPVAGETRHAAAPALQPATLRVLTINTHKGRAPWNRRFMLAELRDAVRTTAADVVFLQEVSGADARHDGEAAGAHYEFLADTLWPQFAYGRNAVYPHGHHGNALLSRFPIVRETNHDISLPGPEPRGLLHCVLAVPEWGELHAVCVHLGLRESHRAQQLRGLCQLLQQQVPADAALVVAGDFNDWRRRAAVALRQCALHSAFARAAAPEPRTFPARWPLLSLDHIYVRGLQVQSACVLSALPWPHLSDHLPLLAEVKR